MSGGRQTGAGRRTTDVERLVDRVAAGQADDPRWSALLRVLTVASRGADVDPEREQAAVIAFRAATTAGPARGVRARRRRSPRAVRALAGGLAAVFALCGVAVAAGTGHLPARGHAAHGGPPPAPVARTTSPAPAPARTGAAPGSTHGPAARTPGPGRSATAEPPEHTRAAAPPRDRSPAAVRSLCRGYLAAVLDGRTPAAQPTDRLQREAGGSRRVAAYCRALLSAVPGGAAK
nr:hypothetical protein OH826_05115 [Streptomyces sp. NBC_00899]WSX80654.1 hypothetical protein OH826_46395 [Streptomyces sp. NBC_00899]